MNRHGPPSEPGVAGLGPARTSRAPARALTGAVILGVVLVVAACSGTALGFDRAPASLAPDSPKLAADGIAFDRARLEVPANVAFVLVFENREAVSHNVSIYADAAHSDRRFEGVLFGGPATRWYPIPALAPGSYVFVCDLHPNMTGTLVAR
jgi:plastocyanin